MEYYLTPLIMIHSAVLLGELVQMQIACVVRGLEAKNFFHGSGEKWPCNDFLTLFPESFRLNWEIKGWKFLFSQKKKQINKQHLDYLRLQNASLPAMLLYLCC